MRLPAQPSPRQPSAVAVMLLPLALWNLAVAQPLYSVIQRHPPFLVAHRADATDLAWVAAALSVALPLLLSLALLGLRRWSSRLVGWSLVGLCGLAAALVVLQLLPASSPSALTLLATGCGSVLAAAAYAYSAGLRRLLELCAVSAILFPALLLWRAGAKSPSEAWRAQLPHGAARTPHPVVVVVFDEWPLVSILRAPEALDRVRFPHLAELADAGVWYPNATTVASTTVLATPPILTGRWPEDDHRAVTADHPVNLFTLLSTGMGLNVFEAGTDLCPESICSGATYVSPERRRLDLLADAAAIALHRIVPEPWAGGLPPVDLGWAHFWPSGRLDSGKPAPADRALVRFDRFLDRMADYPRETLHFIHLHVPHLPWIRLPSGQRYESAEVYPHGLENQLWIGSEWEMLQAWQRHLLQVGLVDTLVGRLTARLRDLALDDETLLVITSDHGTSFRHRRLRRNLNRLNLTELVNIPLFVRRPGGPAGKIDERNATTLDLLPTILASVGIEEPEGLAGRSLFGPPPQSDDKRTYRGGSRRTKRGIALSYRTADLDRAELVERVAGWFGAGDWRLVFRLSLRPELLDRSPDALLSDEPPLELVLRHGWGLARFEPAADVLPIHLAGRLRGWSIEEDPVDLAIAVRGSIVATTRTFVSPGRAHRFTALLDPTRLEPGDNELRIFLVEGDANDPRLRATRLTRPRRGTRR